MHGCHPCDTRVILERVAGSNPALGAKQLEARSASKNTFSKSVSQIGPKNLILKPSFEINILTRFSKLDAETSSGNDFLNRRLESVAANFPAPRGAYSSRAPRAPPPI